MEGGSTSEQREYLPLPEILSSHPVINHSCTWRAAPFLYLYFLHQWTTLFLFMNRGSDCWTLGIFYHWVYLCLVIQSTATSLPMEDYSIYEQRNIPLVCICISLFNEKGNFIHGGWLPYWTMGIPSLACNFIMTFHDKTFLYLEGCSNSVLMFSRSMYHIFSVQGQKFQLLNTGNIFPPTVFLCFHPKYCHISLYYGIFIHFVLL